PTPARSADGPAHPLRTPRHPRQTRETDQRGVRMPTWRARRELRARPQPAAIRRPPARTRRASDRLPSRAAAAEGARRQSQRTSACASNPATTRLIGAVRSVWTAPRRQTARAPHRRLGRQDGDVLADIAPRPQLAARRLPGTRFRQRGGRAEPVRERRLADLGTGCVEQLEERRGPEQIEIAGVRMAIEERPAVPAGPGPAATQPIEAV